MSKPYDWIDINDQAKADADLINFGTSVVFVDQNGKAKRITPEFLNPAALDGLVYVSRQWFE